jgi:iron-sulfur cluster assembly accessory protein
MSTAVETLELGTKATKVLPITLTEKAASEVRRIAAEQASATPLYLRVRVVGGGCSGFQHKLDLDETVNEKLDDTFETNGVNVVIDKRSMLYLDGVTVDFHDDLNKRGFSVSNPNAKTTCGCGSSFSM